MERHLRVFTLQRNSCFLKMKVKWSMKRVEINLKVENRCLYHVKQQRGETFCDIGAMCNYIYWTKFILFEIGILFKWLWVMSGHRDVKNIFNFRETNLFYTRRIMAIMAQKQSLVKKFNTFSAAFSCIISEVEYFLLYLPLLFLCVSASVRNYFCFVVSI